MVHQPCVPVHQLKNGFNTLSGLRLGGFTWVAQGCGVGWGGRREGKIMNLNSSCLKWKPRYLIGLTIGLWFSLVLRKQKWVLDGPVKFILQGWI